MIKLDEEDRPPLEAVTVTTRKVLVLPLADWIRQESGGKLLGPETIADLRCWRVPGCAPDHWVKMMSEWLAGYARAPVANLFNKIASRDINMRVDDIREKGVGGLITHFRGIRRRGIGPWYLTQPTAEFLELMFRADP